MPSTWNLTTLLQRTWQIGRARPLSLFLPVLATSSFSELIYRSLQTSSPKHMMLPGILLLFLCAYPLACLSECAAACVYIDTRRQRQPSLVAVLSSSPTALIARLVAVACGLFVASVLLAVFLYAIEIFANAFSFASHHPGQHMPPHQSHHSDLLIYAWLLIYTVLCSRYSLVLPLWAIDRWSYPGLWKRAISLARPRLWLLILLNGIITLAAFAATRSIRSTAQVPTHPGVLRDSLCVLVSCLLCTWLFMARTEVTLQATTPAAPEPS